MKPTFNNIQNIEILEDEPLSKHTTFGIGGIAKTFIYANSVKGLSQLIKYLNENNLEYIVIGHGTNLLISEKTFDKVFIKLSGDFNKFSFNNEYVTCGSGVSLQSLARETLKNGLGGLEKIGSIPGSIGGASIMNAGVRYFDFSTYVHQIGAIDRQGNEVIFSKDECNYSYRESKFQYTDEYIITFATLKLEKCDTKPLIDVLNASFEKRRQTQPKGKSAGCFFKNSNNQSSGQLIDACGLKGLKINDAMVSYEHGNFILNTNKASFNDVLELANKVKDEVKKQKGFDLVFEVRIIE